MKIAIVYDSRGGTTRAAAEQMSQLLSESGHEAVVQSVSEADPAEVSKADVICVGSWTQGLFIVLQHATRATMEFIGRLGDLSGKGAVVFATYKLSTGSMLPKMAAALEAKGARIDGQFKWKGPKVDAPFREWISSLRS